ncbi:FAD-containing oxidoreductase [Echinicola strongylocentroti]|uniref:FAD-containing oxidoreductase n=1 Tax=Echinicola strongylocentroti TaxID=1795355 RepID=A0A2Z4IIR8_9BACT|nr:mercuric reductase [Echinicola strongylocentroti]AWW30418.1 FAD-containing oxidoreductase [Echinicola strongylocentroti]
MKNYDAVILGAGQSGMPLAKKISNIGLSVALIEKRVIGGTCINDGCSPTKTMVSSARVAHLVSRAADFGVILPSYQVDQEIVKKRKDHIVTLFRGGAEKSLSKNENIDILMGTAAFKDSHTIEITSSTGSTETVKGKKIFINTGSEPRIPEIDGLTGTPYLTSTTVMELEETPEHLLIMGGGYIGLEFAQMFRRFGSNVTIIDRAGRLVSKEDEDVCKEISQIFSDEGIDTLFNSEVRKVTYQDGFTIITKTPEGEKSLKGSHLLVATGRIPSSARLGLENTQIKTTDKGFIRTDDFLKTAENHIYALGDVAGSAPFTHIAYHDAHIAFQHAYKGNGISKKERLVPYCVFIDPQLARIGLNEQEAKDKGIPYKTGKFLMKHAGRTLEVDETRGFFKVLVDPKSKKILGATILSLDGGEIMAILQMAMVGGVTYDTIATLPIAHPTLAESLNNLMGQIE